MAMVSDELVDRVACAIAYSVVGSFEWSALTEPSKDGWRSRARAAIEALSTPDFVLPLAEDMLRGLRAYNKASPDVWFYGSQVMITRGMSDERLHSTLLDAYREAQDSKKRKW